jgi:hypothetical protein
MFKPAPQTHSRLGMLGPRRGSLEISDRPDHELSHKHQHRS